MPERATGGRKRRASMPRDILGGDVRQEDLPDVVRPDPPRSPPPPLDPAPEPEPSAGRAPHQEPLAPGLLAPAFEMLNVAGRSLALFQRMTWATGEAVVQAQLQLLENWVERGREYPGGALWAEVMRAQIQLAKDMVEQVGRVARGDGAEDQDAPRR